MAKPVKYDDEEEISSSGEEEEDQSDAGGSESEEVEEEDEAPAGEAEGEEEVDEEEIEAVTTGAGADDDEEDGGAAAGGEEDEESQSTEDDEPAAGEDDDGDETEDPVGKPVVGKRERARLKELQKLKKQKIQEILDTQNAAIDADMNNKGKGRLKYLLQQTEIFAHFAKGSQSKEKKPRGSADAGWCQRPPFSLVMEKNNETTSNLSDRRHQDQRRWLGIRFGPSLAWWILVLRMYTGAELITVMGSVQRIWWRWWRFGGEEQWWEVVVVNFTGLDSSLEKGKIF